jgi:hypothetical protein
MTTRKIVAALAALFAAGAFALVSAPTVARPVANAHNSGGACTLFCIQGYHCVLHGGSPVCVPNH